MFWLCCFVFCLYVCARVPLSPHFVLTWPWLLDVRFGIVLAPTLFPFVPSLNRGPPPGMGGPPRGPPPGRGPPGRCVHTASIFLKPSSGNAAAPRRAHCRGLVVVVMVRFFISCYLCHCACSLTAVLLLCLLRFPPPPSLEPDHPFFFLIFLQGSAWARAASWRPKVWGVHLWRLLFELCPQHSRCIVVTPSRPLLLLTIPSLALMMLVYRLVC